MELPDRHPEPAAAGARRSNVAGAVWFVVFSTIGVAAVAAALLLPELAALAELEAQRDALAHQLECERKLAAYNERLIRAMDNDPVLTARLLIRYANYSPAGCRQVPIDPSRRDDPVPVQILREAAEPPKRPPSRLATAGQWLSHPPTQTGLILLGLAVVAIAWLLFGVRRETPTRGGRGRQAR
jgi:hypothetical protein